MGENVPNYAPAGERLLPVLEAQPPLPNLAPVRLVKHEDEDNQERALVPAMPYVKESQEWTRNPPVTFSEG